MFRMRIFLATLEVCTENSIENICGRGKAGFETTLRGACEVPQSDDADAINGSRMSMHLGSLMPLSRALVCFQQKSFLKYIQKSGAERLPHLERFSFFPEPPWNVLFWFSAPHGLEKKWWCIQLANTKQLGVKRQNMIRYACWRNGRSIPDFLFFSFAAPNQRQIWLVLFFARTSWEFTGLDGHLHILFGSTVRY